MSAASAARRTGRRFYAVAILIYLSVVAALAALALFGRGATERLGDVKVTARYAALPLFGRVVDQAAVSYQGLRLSLDRSTPIEPASGGDPALLTGMRSHGEGIDIGFERDLRLELRRVDGGSWSLALAGAADEGLSLRVPLSVPGGLAPLGEVPLVSWRRAGRSYSLSLPQGSRLDAAAGALELSFGAGSRELRFGPAVGEGEDPSARWLSDQAALIDPQGFEAARGAFLDAAWLGWTKARRSPDGTLWTGADGRSAFNEEVGPALLAEAIERGEYAAYRAPVAAALNRQLRQAPASVQSAAVSVFVGNLREHVRRVRASEAPGIERIRTLLAGRDPALFLVPGLIPFVLDHGPFNLVQEIVTLAGTLRAGSLEPATALGVLEAYLDYDRYAAAGGAMAARAREVVRRRLVPSIRKTDTGLFLETTAGSVDTVATLRCGALLVRAGAALEDMQFTAIGRTLIASAVALGRADGFLPGTLELSGTTASPPDDAPETVAPETVYPFVAVDRHLPREIPLHLDVGPGTWLWTAADLVSAEGSPTGLTLTVAFPAGQPHYLVVDGVRSIEQLSLHGTAWRPAADYAQYSDGWTWDAAEQLLFVKLTGEADTEEIVITY
jgi:hypothetical protein